jgi:HPt (histidine-containing phosphotransfer) domain-containing protein
MADMTGPLEESRALALPPIASEGAAIDVAHLAQMTLGDRKLEKEVLELFDRQAEQLLARMHAAEPAGLARLAHTLVGSARGIGAWRVAAAAEALEGTVAATGQPALGELTAAVEEARRAIGGLFRATSQV